MSQFTLVSGDILYLPFYLKEKDASTGSITGYDLTTASSIVFRMREYNAASNTIETEAITITAISCTLGYCVVPITVPVVTNQVDFKSEIQVFDTYESPTWIGDTYTIIPQLG